MSVIGARLANGVSLRDISLLGCLLVGGCLVTDQVELDPTPTTPPIVTATTIPLGSVIRINTTQVNDLQIPFQVRDDNTQDTLKVRYHIVSGTKAPSAFACPEPITIPPTAGALLRNPISISIAGTQLDPGSCSQVEIVVSSTFLSCKTHPTVFDVTTPVDGDLGRATFWVWETSTDPLTNPTAARALLGTCPAIDWTTQTSMTMGQGQP